MNIILRKYQIEAILAIQKFFKDGGFHCILEAPTGAGKTIMFTDIAARVASKNNKVLILTDRVELLRQAGGALEKFNLEAFYIQAGSKHVSNSYNCYIAMSQTLKRRITKQYWIKFIQSIDLVVIDEAHKQEFNYLFKSGLVDKKHVIGATATPARSGKMRQLALDYRQIIHTDSVRGLIDKGFLVNSDNYTFEPPNLEGVGYNSMSGDFNLTELYGRFNSTKRYGGVIKNYAKISPGTKTLCFCVNIDHAINTCKEFNKAGISAKFVVSNVQKPAEEFKTKGEKVKYDEKVKAYENYTENFKLFSGDRAEVFREFKDNKFQVLVNADIATTGFDMPDIETIILNRATTSITLYLQMIGRGSRVAPGKTHFNILDFGGNIERFDKYDDKREWSLWHNEGKGGGLPPVKECGYTSSGEAIGKGGCRILIHAGLTICPFCGFKYPEKKEKEVDLELLMEKNRRPVKRMRDMSFQELHDYWKERGHKSAWLWRQLYFRGGTKEIERFGRAYGWSWGVIRKAQKITERMVG